MGIRKSDIDLETGVIKLHETKNNHERLVVMGKDMNSLMAQFADKCFYLIDNDGYIFTNRNGASGSSVVVLYRSVWSGFYPRPRCGMDAVPYKITPDEPLG